PAKRRERGSAPSRSGYWFGRRLLAVGHQLQGLEDPPGPYIPSPSPPGTGNREPLLSTEHRALSTAHRAPCTAHCARRTAPKALPLLPVSDALERQAGGGLEVFALEVGDGEEHGLGDVVGDAEEFGDLLFG